MIHINGFRPFFMIKAIRYGARPIQELADGWVPGGQLRRIFQLEFGSQSPVALGVPELRVHFLLVDQVGSFFYLSVR